MDFCDPEKIRGVCGKKTTSIICSSFVSGQPSCGRTIESLSSCPYPPEAESSLMNTEMCHQMSLEPIFYPVYNRMQSCFLLLCSPPLHSAGTAILPFSEMPAALRSIHLPPPLLPAPTICKKLLPISSVSLIFSLTSIHCWQHVLSLALLNSFCFLSAISFCMLILLFLVVSGSWGPGSTQAACCMTSATASFRHCGFISDGRFVSRTL